MEEANYLSRFASKVTLVHRRDSFRASKIMQDRVLDNPKIEVLWNSAITEMYGDPSKGGLTGVQIQNTLDSKLYDLECDGVFIAIGHKPNSDLFQGQLELNESGYILTKEDSSLTSIEGVFAAGDIHDIKYRQAITAAGSGCKAALDAEHYLDAL